MPICFYCSLSFLSYQSPSLDSQDPCHWTSPGLVAAIAPASVCRLHKKTPSDTANSIISLYDAVAQSRLWLGHSETPTANSCSDCPSFSLGCVLYAKMRHLCTGLAEHSSGRSGWVSPGKHLSSPPAMLSAWLKLSDESSILQKDDLSIFIKSWESLSVGSW